MPDFSTFKWLDFSGQGQLPVAVGAATDVSRETIGKFKLPVLLSYRGNSILILPVQIRVIYV